MNDYAIRNALLWSKRSGAQPPRCPYLREVWVRHVPPMNPLSWPASAATLGLLWLLDPERRIPSKASGQG